MMRLLLGKATASDLKDLQTSFAGVELVYPLYLTWTRSERARLDRLVRQGRVREIAWKLPAIWLANEEMRGERLQLLSETQSGFSSPLIQYTVDTELPDPFWDTKRKWSRARLLCVQGRHPARWVRRYGETQLREFAREIVRLKKKDEQERSVILAYSGRYAEAEVLMRFYDEATPL